jgi:hypothetical protein
MSSIDTNGPWHPDLRPGTLDLPILRALQKDALRGWAMGPMQNAISRAMKLA